MSNDVEEYRGKRALIRFEGKRCIHSRGCVLGRPDVFMPNTEGPWIKPDNASPEQIAELAHDCPSGAITYERLNGGPAEAAPIVNVVRVRENGPLAVLADLRLEGQPPSLRATLCRCGASANKPFCDGSHSAAAFTASGEPTTQDSTPLERRDGALAVTPLKDGPLLVTGNVEICSGTGRTVTRTQKVALCRCGASADKPFCDGSHARVGFTSG